METIYEKPKYVPPPQTHCTHYAKLVIHAKRIIAKGQFLEAGSIVQCDCGKYFRSKYSNGAYFGGKRKENWAPVRWYHFGLQKRIAERKEINSVKKDINAQA